MTDTHLLAQLAEQRTHVLQAVSGLTETAMSRALTPSGWTMTQQLNHLALDVEAFWASAVLGGDPTASAALHDGWASEPMDATSCSACWWRRPSTPVVPTSCAN